MATLTISLTVGAQTFSYSETTSDANAQRIGPAYLSLLRLEPGSSNQTIWDALGRGVCNTIRSNVLAQERLTQEAAIVVPVFNAE